MNRRSPVLQHRMLEALHAAQGQPVSRVALLEVLYRDPANRPATAHNVCDALAHLLRRKGLPIRARRGFGYYLAGARAPAD